MDKINEVKKMSEKLPEGVLNLLEMVIRCYDCCLSCSAHITLVKKGSGEKIDSRPLNVGIGALIKDKENRGDKNW